MINARIIDVQTRAPLGLNVAAEELLKASRSWRLKQASNRRGQPRNVLKTLDNDLRGRNCVDFGTVRLWVQIPGPPTSSNL